MLYCILHPQTALRQIAVKKIKARQRSFMGEHASARAGTDCVPELMDALASVAAPELN